jgi:hypothetical protein
MEQLTGDGGSLPDTLADTEAELDRALAGAIRRLISEQNALIGSQGARDLLPLAGHAANERASTLVLRQGEARVFKPHGGR